MLVGYALFFLLAIHAISNTWFWVRPLCFWVLQLLLNSFHYGVRSKGNVQVKGVHVFSDYTGNYCNQQFLLCCSHYSALACMASPQGTLVFRVHGRPRGTVEGLGKVRGVGRCSNHPGWIIKQRKDWFYKSSLAHIVYSCNGMQLKNSKWELMSNLRVRRLYNKGRLG